GQPACVALSTPSASSSAARFASLPPSFPPAPARDRPASELFFILQLLRRDLRYHGAQPIDLSLLPRLDSALARCPLAFTLQRACGPVIRNSAPSIKHRWRQAVSATDLADRYPRLLRFPQNRQLLFRCKSPILTHGPRASCGLPAAARSFPFFGFVFVPKSLKLHICANHVSAKRIGSDEYSGINAGPHDSCVHALSGVTNESRRTKRMASLIPNYCSCGIRTSSLSCDRLCRSSTAASKRRLTLRSAAWQKRRGFCASQKA